MRKIDRSTVVEPDILSSDSLKIVRKQIEQHFELPESERRRRRVQLNTSIFDDRGLLKAMEQVFGKNCAYCERPLSAVWSRHVSHYRPTSNAALSGGHGESPDHYIWLAYTWKNLLLLCEQCDEAKSNHFPVEANIRALPLSTWKECVRQEKPLLLDPCADTPDKHLQFTPDGFVVGKTVQGNATIDILALNRPMLIRDRKIQFDQLIRLIRSRSFRKNDPFLQAPGPYQGAVSNLAFEIARLAGVGSGMRSVLKRLDLADLLDWMADLSPHEIDDALARIGSGSSPAPADVPQPHLIVRGNQDAQPRLVWIRIENFKGISNLELDLRLDDPRSQSKKSMAATMLLGENSAGKSSVLQAIALALMGKTAMDRLEVDPDDFVSRRPDGWQFTHDKPLSVTLKFADDSTAELHYDTHSQRFITTRTAPYQLIAYGAQRVFQPGRSGKLHKSLFDPGALLADPNNWLRGLGPNEFDAVSRAMRSILALRSEDRILRSPEGLLLVHAHGRTTPIDHMSEGYKSLFVMGCDIMRHMLEKYENLEFARGMVLIDEIDIHLHPRWKMRVVAALREAMPQVQFIATTHDPLCLRGMRNGEVLVMYRDEAGDVCLIDELPNVENMRVEQILTSDFFGLYSTSDPEQERILNEISELAIYDDNQLTNDQRMRRDQLLDQYGSVPVLRESRDRQILAEAITRHLRNHPAHDLRRSALMREDSIKTIQEILEKAF